MKSSTLPQRRFSLSPAGLLALAASLVGNFACTPTTSEEVCPKHETGEEHCEPIEADAGTTQDEDAGVVAPDTDAGTTTGDAVVGTASTSGGSYQVKYLANPGIPLNEPFALTLDISPLTETAADLSTINIVVDARMPQHNHGMNTRPNVEKVADGQYSVTGMLMHMPGEWELYVDVQAGESTERATFVVLVE